jgi:hypothetical protein
VAPARWSPDGTQIMVVRDAGGVIALYTMNAGGGGWREVTHGLAPKSRFARAQVAHRPGWRQSPKALEELYPQRWEPRR